MGSGTTALGCIEEGTSYIGSEMKDEHYKTSLNRINLLKKDIHVEKIK
jgi:DNA modification methylase